MEVVFARSCRDILCSNAVRVIRTMLAAKAIGAVLRMMIAFSSKVRRTRRAVPVQITMNNIMLRSPLQRLLRNADLSFRERDHVAFGHGGDADRLHDVGAGNGGHALQRVAQQVGQQAAAAP